MRAHIKAPYKIDLLWETLGALNRPGRARTVRSRTFCTSPASHAFEFGFAPPGFTTDFFSAESDGVDAGAGAGVESDGAGADAETSGAETDGAETDGSENDGSVGASAGVTSGVGVPSGKGSGHQCGSGSGHHFGAAAAASPLYSVSFGSPAAASCFSMSEAAGAAIESPPVTAATMTAPVTPADGRLAVSLTPAAVAGGAAAAGSMPPRGAAFAALSRPILAASARTRSM